MYRIIDLDFYRCHTNEYTFHDLDEARERFNEICNECEFNTVVLENDETHEVLDHN